MIAKLFIATGILLYIVLIVALFICTWYREEIEQLNQEIIPEDDDI